MKINELNKEQKQTKLSPLYKLERKTNLKPLIIFSAISAIVLFIVIALFHLNKRHTKIYRTIYIRKPDLVTPNAEKQTKAIANAIAKAINLPRAVLMVSFFVGCIVNIAIILPISIFFLSYRVTMKTNKITRYFFISCYSFM